MQENLEIVKLVCERRRIHMRKDWRAVSDTINHVETGPYIMYYAMHEVIAVWISFIRKANYLYETYKSFCATYCHGVEYCDSH
jgi:hypothetical protein